MNLFIQQFSSISFFKILLSEYLYLFLNSLTIASDSHDYNWKHLKQFLKRPKKELPVNKEWPCRGIVQRTRSQWCPQQGWLEGRWWSQARPPGIGWLWSSWWPSSCGGSSTPPRRLIERKRDGEWTKRLGSSEERQKSEHCYRAHTPVLKRG